MATFDAELEQLLKDKLESEGKIAHYTAIKDVVGYIDNLNGMVDGASSTNGTLNYAMKSGGKYVSLLADVAIYEEAGDSLAKAIMRTVIVNITGPLVDSLVEKIPGGTAVNVAIGIGKTTYSLQSAGDFVSGKVDAWFSWSVDKYFGPNINYEIKSSGKVIITSRGGSISHILGYNWVDGENGVVNLKNAPSWKISSTEELQIIEFDSADNNLIEIRTKAELTPNLLEDVLTHLATNNVIDFTLDINGVPDSGKNYMGYAKNSNYSWFLSNYLDDRVFYAIQHLKGFTLESEFQSHSELNINKNLFSRKYIESRIDFFSSQSSSFGMPISVQTTQQSQ